MKNRNLLFSNHATLKGTGSSIAVAFTLLAPTAFAANQYFSDAGGPLSWDTTTANWGAATTGPYNTAWTLGNAAVFEGTAGTVNVGAGVNSPTCGNITFSLTGYTLQGGEIIFNTSPTISVPANSTTVINSVLGQSGIRNVQFKGTSGSSSVFTIGGANTFTGTATINAAAASFDTLANGGVASSFGQGGNTVAVIVCNGASFARANYTGSGGSTDRPWTVNGAAGSGGSINNNGSGAINFHNTGSAFGGTLGSRTLSLGGSYTAAANTFAETIDDMAGFASLLKIDGNTWNIAGNNSHSGGTTLGTNGLLNIAHVNALGTGIFTVGGNGSFDNTTGSDLTVANDFTLSGGSPVYVGSANNMTLSGAVTLSGANRKITVSGNALTLDGIVGEDASPRTLSKEGLGTLVLSNANAYSGGTNISTAGGSLRATHSSALGSGDVTVSTSTLALSGSISIANNLSLKGTGNGALLSEAGDNTVTGNIALAGTTTIINTDAAGVSLTLAGTLDLSSYQLNLSGKNRPLSVSGKITGSSSLLNVVSTTNNVTFSNDTSDFTAPISTGYVRNLQFTSIGNVGAGASALGAPTNATEGTITFNNSSSFTRFEYIGTSAASTDRVLLMNGTGGALNLVNASGAKITYTANLGRAATSTGLIDFLTDVGSITEFSGNLTNGASATALDLRTSSSGTVILSGTNSYTGTTTVNASSTLLVNGTHNSGGLTTVDGTLGGSGALNGTVLVTTGGQIAPGESIGTLTAADVTLNSGASLAAEIDSSTTSSDSLVATGTLTLDVDSQLLVSDAAAIPATLPLATVLTIYSGPVASITGTFKDLPEGGTIAVGSNTFAISYTDGSAITLTTTAAVADPYTDWIDSYTSLTTPTEKAKGADPDNDGLPNALEFLLGGDPSDSTDKGNLWVGVSGNQLVLSLAIRGESTTFSGSPSPSTTVEGISCAVQGSLDLAAFASATTEITFVQPAGWPASAPVGSSYHSFKLDASAGLTNKGFMRLQSNY